MKNLNLLFNKIYFKDIYCEVTMEDGNDKYKIVSGKDKKGNKTIDKLNKELFSTGFAKTDYRPCPFDDSCSGDECGFCNGSNPCSKGIHRFLLKTTYPGLLSGLGNPHDAANDESALKAGFSFDYTTGQPYIPGSTVKGVLRSFFREHPDAVAEINNSVNEEKINEHKVKELEPLIFDGNDVFFDAVIYWHDPYGELVSGDTITPHGDDVTKNPRPVQMLRINPGVKLEFRFKLTSVDGMSAGSKSNLFKELLKVFGIGAKTNVGYGRLDDTDGLRPNPIPKPVFYPAGQPRNNNNNNNNRRGNNRGGNRGNYGNNNRIR